jgi:hypothetical protein
VAAFSPIMMVGALVLPDVMVGMIGITRHVGDGLDASEELAIRETLTQYEYAIEPVCLFDVPVDRVGNR